MTPEYSSLSESANKKSKWERDEIAGKIVDFEQAKKEQSQRQFAQEQGVPRTTLQYWLSRKEAIDSSPKVKDFFESPEGLACLHKIVTAAHFVFTKDGVASIHNISRFIELSGIGEFVGGSYSTHQRASVKMDNLIIEFGANERAKLVANMPTKTITVTEDETFHPQICMVAIEPVSNFIIAEKYVENRDGKTWEQVVSNGMSDVKEKVEIIQLVSDEGRALLNHASKSLKVHHSSDCFHVAYEVGKGSCGALASVVRKAQKEHDTAVEQTKAQESKKQNYDEKAKNFVGCRPDFEEKIAQAKQAENQAKLALEIAVQNQEQVRQAKAQIGQIYHPYDPQTGKEQDDQTISKRLESCFDTINKATQSLSDNSKKRIQKAHRVVDKMVVTIRFFFCMIDIYLHNMELSKLEKSLMREYLIPGFYLQEVARKEKDPQAKSAITAKSLELLSILTVENGLFCDYSPDQIKKLEKAALECAQIFQRSSSCVEGRNAQLSLRHHGIHRLSDRCLKAQTIIHNFDARNKDGATPAERFFEAKHADLFEWILEKMEYPVRPRNHLRKAA